MGRYTTCFCSFSLWAAQKSMSSLASKLKRAGSPFTLQLEACVYVFRPTVKLCPHPHTWGWIADTQHIISSSCSSGCAMFVGRRDVYIGLVPQGFLSLGHILGGGKSQPIPAKPHRKSSVRRRYSPMVPFDPTPLLGFPRGGTDGTIVSPPRSRTTRR